MELGALYRRVQHKGQVHEGEAALRTEVDKVLLHLKGSEGLRIEWGRKRVMVFPLLIGVWVYESCPPQLRPLNQPCYISSASFLLPCV